jgi:glycosyltransferase involved in cell wall biosynthesis
LIVVNSQWSKRSLERANIHADKITVIPVAFDTNDFGRREKSYESIVPAKFSFDEPLKIIFIGRVSIEKGIHHLLQAAHELKKDPVLFQLIGALNLSRQLLASAPGNVQFIGPVPRGSVKTHLERAHLLLFPSPSDGFGIVQLEAHASGLPVLASANCGDVVVDGQTGLILAELTPAVISDAIRRTIQHPEALLAMSRLAHNRAMDFSLARVGRMWVQEIRSMQSMDQLTQ